MKPAVITITIIIIIGLLAAAIYISLTPMPPSESGGQNTGSATDNLNIEIVADYLETPWAIDFIDQEKIIFTERSGKVRMIENGRIIEEPLLELPQAASEGGTLGLALDPDFSAGSSYVYLYYTTEQTDNRISRFTYQDKRLVDEEILVDDIPGNTIHNGGRLRFGPNGKLYAGTGDADNPDLAQDIDSLAGKILRLEPNGAIPDDNPRSDSYVYSMGHRNVQGLAWDEDGQLFASEHGPDARDEINLIEPGANYGWPETRGEIELDSRADAPVSNYRNPLLESGNDTWAPSGLEYYSDDTLPEEWRSKLLFTGLRSQTLWRLDPTSLELQGLYSGDYGRLRDVRTGPAGNVYVLTSNLDGRGQPVDNDDRILRISPVSR